MPPRYRIIIDTRKDQCLCPLCAAQQKIHTSFRNDIYEIFMFECPQCGYVTCLMLQRETG